MGSVIVSWVARPSRHTQTAESPLFACRLPPDAPLVVADKPANAPAPGPFRRFEHKPVPGGNAHRRAQDCISRRSDTPESHLYSDSDRSRGFPIEGEPRRTKDQAEWISSTRIRSRADPGRHPGFCG